MTLVALSAPEPTSTDPTGEFRAIYVEHFSFVWRSLRSLGIAPNALDDAAQEVFLAIHRRLGDFRGESTLRTWVYGIVRNVASNQRRSTRRRGDEAPLSVEMSSGAQGPLDSVQDREAGEFMQRFLAALDTKKREVFALAVLEEMSVPEVAEALGVPLNTAYTRLRAARQDFQRALARRGTRT